MGDPHFLRRVRANLAPTDGYDALVERLRLLHPRYPFRTVLLTSARPQEGKTTITVNLAFAIARAGGRALILDADLRTPKIHEILGLANLRGFSDILAGRIETQDISEVEQILEFTTEPSEAKQSLGVITSGNARESGVAALASAALRHTFEHLASVHDIVLIDAPPVLSSGDPLFLAPWVDRVLLITNTGVVTRKDLNDAKERLQEVGAHILGVVMNRFDVSRHGPGLHPDRSRGFEADP